MFRWNGFTRRIANDTTCRARICAAFSKDDVKARIKVSILFSLSPTPFLSPLLLNQPNFHGPSSCFNAGRSSLR